jgi:hypothetical protein
MIEWKKVFKSILMNIFLTLNWLSIGMSIIFLTLYFLFYNYFYEFINNRIIILIFMSCSIFIAIISRIINTCLLNNCFIYELGSEIINI